MWGHQYETTFGWIRSESISRPLQRQMRRRVAVVGGGKPGTGQGSGVVIRPPRPGTTLSGAGQKPWRFGASMR